MIFLWSDIVSSTQAIHPQFSINPHKESKESPEQNAPSPSPRIYPSTVRDAGGSDDGQYKPDNSGQYKPDNSGQYKPEGTGQRQGRDVSFGDLWRAGLGYYQKGGSGLQAAKNVAQNHKRTEKNPMQPQTDYENKRQIAMQGFHKAMQNSSKEMFENGNMYTGIPVRDKDGKFHVSDEVKAAGAVLGNVIGDENIQDHIQNNFLPLVSERNEHARNNPEDVQPEIDDKKKDYFGSRGHVRFGMDLQRDLQLGRPIPMHDAKGTVVTQKLSAGNPELAAELNPTGGLVGPGNDELVLYKEGDDQIMRHGQLHDAGGYALLNHGAGPGYTYRGADYQYQGVNAFAGKMDSNSRDSTQGQRLLNEFKSGEADPLIETEKPQPADVELGPVAPGEDGFKKTHPFR